MKCLVSAELKLSLSRPSPHAPSLPLRGRGGHKHLLNVYRVLAHHCAQSFPSFKQRGNPDAGISIRLLQLRKSGVQKTYVIYARTHGLSREEVRFRSQAPKCSFCCVDRSLSSDVLSDGHTLTVALLFKWL